MKKKGFKFNFVDISIVVVLIAVVALAGFIIADKTIDNKSSGEVFSYELLFREIPEEIVSKIQKDIVIYEGGKNTEIGKIADMEIKESTKYEFNTLTGEYMNVEVPERYDVTLNISSKGERDKMSYFIDEYEIYVGKAVDITSLGFVAHGYVVAVNWEVEKWIRNLM